MLGLSKDYAGFPNQLKRTTALLPSAGLRILCLGGEPGPADSPMAPILHHNPFAHRYDTGNHSQIGAFSFSGLGYIGPVFPAKAGIHITAAYGNFPMARLYGFPPARE